MKRTFYIILICAISALTLTSAAILFSLKIQKEKRIVVVYLKTDKRLSQSILKDFEKEYNLKVHAVYDSDITHKKGIVGQLISQRGNPHADVFWCDEPKYALKLKDRGVSANYISLNSVGIPPEFKDPQGYWTGFSAKAKVILVNKKVPAKPKSITALTEPVWRQRCAIPDPALPSSQLQFTALFDFFGEERFQFFLSGMKNNRVTILPDEQLCADKVASGEFDFTIVDNDIGISSILQGKPVQMVYPDQKNSQIGCLLIPQVAVLIKNAPHTENGKKLIDYLLSRETEQKLAFSDFALIPLHEGVPAPNYIPAIERLKIIRMDYSLITPKMNQSSKILGEWVKNQSQ